MSVTTSVTPRFADYYFSLVSRPISFREKLNNVMRDEYSERKKIKNEQRSGFQDVLHIAGHWIGEKRAGVSAFFGTRYVSMKEFLAWKKEREIWFPPIVPKVVLFTRRPRIPGYPYDKVTALLNEEKELRDWLNGVQEQQMKRITMLKDQQLNLLECEIHLQKCEARERWRMTEEETETRRNIKRQVFLNVPSAFFIQRVRERFGGTGGIKKPPTLEEIETVEREKIEQLEQQAWRKIAKIPQDILETNIFALHHQEVVRREEIVKEEMARVYDLMTHASRITFGIYYYHTPALAFHVDPPRCPLLRWMVTATAAVFCFSDKKSDVCEKGVMSARSSQKRGTVAPFSFLPDSAHVEGGGRSEGVDSSSHEREETDIVEEDENEEEESVEGEKVVHTRKTTAMGGHEGDGGEVDGGAVTPFPSPRDGYDAPSPAPVPVHMQLPTNPSWRAIEEEERRGVKGRVEELAFPSLYTQAEPGKGLVGEVEAGGGGEVGKGGTGGSTFQSGISVSSSGAVLSASKARELQERRLRSIGCSSVLRRDSTMLLPNTTTSSSLLQNGGKPKVPLVKHACWKTLSAVPSEESRKALQKEKFSSALHHTPSPHNAFAASANPSLPPARKHFLSPITPNAAPAARAHEKEEDSGEAASSSYNSHTPTTHASDGSSPPSAVVEESCITSSSSSGGIPSLSSPSSSVSFHSTKKLPKIDPQQKDRDRSLKSIDNREGGRVSASAAVGGGALRGKGENRGIQEGLRGGEREESMPTAATAATMGEGSAAAREEDEVERGVAESTPHGEPSKKGVVKVYGGEVGAGGKAVLSSAKRRPNSLPGLGVSTSLRQDMNVPIITKYPPRYPQRRNVESDSEMDIHPWMKTSKYNGDALRLPPIRQQ